MEVMEESWGSLTLVLAAWGLWPWEVMLPPWAALPAWEQVLIAWEPLPAWGGAVPCPRKSALTAWEPALPAWELYAWGNSASSLGVSTDCLGIIAIS